MRMKLMPAPFHGEVQVPASKSMAHRALIAAGFSDGCKVQNVSFSADIDATLRCLSALGFVFSVDREKGEVVFTGERKPVAGRPVFDCGESGSTLRFLLPIAAQLCPKGAFFSGSAKLLSRPIDPFLELLAAHGVRYIKERDEIFIKNALLPGRYRINGNVSSQYITGLLFALSLCENGESTISILDKLESRGYVAMTLAAMEAFGVHADNYSFAEFIIKGGQRYRRESITVEADYSQAAFFLTAGYYGFPVKALGLNENSLQGDKAILPLLERLKMPGEQRIDLSQIPDLAPILAAAAAVRSGATKLYNGARLRYKESDRIAATVQELSRLGVQIRERPDGMEIIGKKVLGGSGTIYCDSHNDHRIAMTIAIAALKCAPQCTVILNGAEAVNKSYPDFWKDYRALGGIAVKA